MEGSWSNIGYEYTVAYNIIMKITFAHQRDVPKIAELNTQFVLDIPDFYWTDKKWITDQVKNRNYFLGYHNGRIIGALCLRVDNSCLVIGTIAVVKEMQGKGIGKRFVEFAKKAALEKNLHRVTVETFIQYNLKDFHEHCGFRLANPEVGYYKGIPYYRYVMDV